MPPTDDRRASSTGIEIGVGVAILDSLREIREDVRETRTAFDKHKDDVVIRLDRLEQQQSQKTTAANLKVTGIVAIVAASVGGVFTALGERFLK